MPRKYPQPKIIEDCTNVDRTHRRIASVYRGRYSGSEFIGPLDGSPFEIRVNSREFTSKDEALDWALEVYADDCFDEGDLPEYEEDGGYA